MGCGVVACLSWAGRVLTEPLVRRWGLERWQPWIAGAVVCGAALVGSLLIWWVLGV